MLKVHVDNLIDKVINKEVPRRAVKKKSIFGIFSELKVKCQIHLTK